MLKESYAPCAACGECCYAEIPITLLDIQRISERDSISPKDVFKRIISTRQIGTSGLFCINSLSNGACIYLSDKRCRIHDIKPTACRLFQCDCNKKSTQTISTNLEHRKQLLWESSVSAEVTRAYIKQYQTQWNEDVFHRAVDTIQRSIVSAPGQKLAYALNGEGGSVGEVYDCDNCPKHGEVAPETPVTLLDIRGIAQGLNRSVADIFSEFLKPHPSRYTGGLQLKRSKHCIFFHPETHCRIKSFRPKHCQLTPCAKRLSNPELYQCLFLGAGTIDDQFTHQLALEVTRKYVANYGAAFVPDGFSVAMHEMQSMKSDSNIFQLFREHIAPYRPPVL